MFRSDDNSSRFLTGRRFFWGKSYFIDSNGFGSNTFVGINPKQHIESDLVMSIDNKLTKIESKKFWFSSEAIIKTMIFLMSLISSDFGGLPITSKASSLSRVYPRVSVVF